jgi:hypothetical protein
MAFFSFAIFLPCLSFSHVAAKVFLALSVALVVFLVLWCTVVSWSGSDGREVMRMYREAMRKHLLEFRGAHDKSRNMKPFALSNIGLPFTHPRRPAQDDVRTTLLE